MRDIVGNFKSVLREWRVVLSVAAILAIPTYGFTVPLQWAVLAHTCAVLVYVLHLLVWPRDAIEGAILPFIAAVIFALASHAPALIQSSHQPPKHEVGLLRFFGHEERSGYWLVVDGFESNWRMVAEGAMSTVTIVEALDKIENGEGGFGSSVEVDSVEALGF